MTCSLNGLLSLTLVALSAMTAAHGAEPTRVKVETSAGEFIVQLDADRSPLSVANFLDYARSGFYDGTIFHRVVNGFVVQGGGYTPDMKLKAARPSVANESGNGLPNRRGSVAMARTGDPHSADSQFYVNLADNLALDPKPTRWGYAVFGEVIEGMEVVDKIGHQLTGNKGGLQDVPIEDVVIRRVTVLNSPAAR